MIILLRTVKPLGKQIKKIILLLIPVQFFILQSMLT